ncbi:hypothetical protein, partial [Pseudomonas proteolytica]|uniref:hypothetical protein n=1 Tax=Pseudomonas proteolytica TaxID=219574 RepID=UPI0030D783D6
MNPKAASIPTASVDALVHVNAYGDRDAAQPFIIRSGWMVQAVAGVLVYNCSKRGRLPRTVEPVAISSVIGRLLMWIDPRRVEMNMGPIVNGAGRKVMMAAAASLALGAMTL